MMNFKHFVALMLLGYCIMAGAYSTAQEIVRYWNSHPAAPVNPVSVGPNKLCNIDEDLNIVCWINV